MRPWQWLRRMLYAGLRNETEERLKSSAVIFAPHQDDETLGCGGTIMLKRKAGTPVACVFMTDGSTSHRSFMKDDEGTHAVVTDALNKVGRPVEICEYPIWFWNQWPWVPFHIRCNRESGRMLWRMLFSGFGLRLLLE